MSGIHWSEMMSVGVPILDADHRILIGLINLLQRSIGDAEEYAAVGSVLGALKEYAANHFDREERMMQACRFPALASHRLTHAGFVGEVEQLLRRYEADQTSVRARDCLTFLNRWLIDHICTSDMGYRISLIGHREALEAGGVGPLVVTSPLPDGEPNVDWRRLRVLVVDDNLNFREILSTILGAAGIGGVAMVQGLDEARAALMEGGFGLVILDWHIGAESGLDLVRWLRLSDGPAATLPVLMLSAYEGSERRDVALAAGADDFMSKPITASSLLDCLARLVVQSRVRS
jgi:hemerythrin-like metal-binding protein